MDRILTGLGFAPINSQRAREKNLTYVVPSWRNDVELGKEDLIEEIARHTGYEKIASELPPSNSSGEYQPGRDEAKGFCVEHSTRSGLMKL